MNPIYIVLFLSFGFSQSGTATIYVEGNKVQDSTKVSSLIHLSRDSRDTSSAIEYAREAMKLALARKDTTAEISSLVQLGNIYSGSNQVDIAMRYYARALNKTRNKLLKARLALDISQTLSGNNHYTAAIQYVRPAQEIYQKIKDRKGISVCYSALGNISLDQAEYEKAADYFFSSLAIKKELGDDRGISILLSSIGNTYLLANRHEEARTYFLKSLVIDRKNEDQEGIMLCFMNIGVVYERQGNRDEAISHYNQALSMARHLNFRFDEAILLGNIGSTLLSDHQYDKALDYLFRSLEIKKELGAKGSIAHTCNNISKTYLALNNYEEARKYGLMAKESAGGVDKNRLVGALKNLALSEYGLGNYQKAYNYQELSHAFSDSIFTQASAENINELEMKYETAQKEEQIAGLTRQRETEKLKQYIYILGGLLLSISLFLLYYQQRTRSRRAGRQLEQEHELEQMKSRFFANISHEFRTPLTLILGPLTSLLENSEREKDTKQFRVMEKNARRLLDLINQLLDLSKLESGQLQLQSERHDIIKVIKGVVLSFHSFLEQKEVGITLTSEMDVLDMNFDQAKLETILINIVGNAFKFTPAGGQITIVIQRKIKKTARKSRTFISVKVEDSGTGIPASDLEHIFNRFYQSDQNQLEQHDGSGIGLALTKELVELHEGEIKATSVVGQGTSLEFAIPIDLPACGRASKLRPERELLLKIDPDEPTEVKGGTKPLILVIEDQVEVFQYIEDVLKEEYDVAYSRDGEDGIARAIECIPDLIISDVMMPRKNGYEVCEYLKNDERTSHIPILLLTAKADQEDKIEGLGSRADDYITKPFVPRELLLRINNQIQAREQLRIKYQKMAKLTPKDVTSNSIDEQFLERIMSVVEEHMDDEKFGVVSLGAEIGLSRSQLHRKLSALLGEGPSQFIRSFRLKRAHQLLEQHAATASEISFLVGFSSHSYFSKCFHEQFGYAPSHVLKDKL